MENERADGRDGRTCLAKSNSQARTGTGNNIFPAHRTTSRIGNLTRLIHTLLYQMTNIFHEDLLILAWCRCETGGEPVSPLFPLPVPAFSPHTRQGRGQPSILPRKIHLPENLPSSLTLSPTGFYFRLVGKRPGCIRECAE